MEATAEQIQPELDKLLMQLVTDDGWFYDTKKRAFEIGPSDIPKDVLPQIDQLLKRGNFPINDENRTRLYIEKLKAEQGKK